jgi:hypothetical protein
VEDERGEPLWGAEPVHPKHEGYNRIVDFVCAEAERLTGKGGTKKRAATQDGPPGKKPRTEAARPRWWTSRPLLQRCEEGRPEGQPEAGATTTRTATVAVAGLVEDSPVAAVAAVAAEMGEAVAVAAAGSTRVGEAGAARAPKQHLSASSSRELFFFV